MDPSLFESLLYQEESEALDFKQELYPFSKATDAQKGELLKDILAFVNAWRQTDAHILIGVEEVRGGRGIVRGIDPADHLLDRNLQQFVSSKTNRPLSFSYSPFAFEGVEIGVLTIPSQDRPAYLISNFAYLKSNVVYIRRGSSTGEATPDEVIRMIANPVTQHGQPILQLEFANLTTRQRFAGTISVRPEILHLPEKEAIPLYGKEPATAFGRSIDMFANMDNRQYYQQVAVYLQNRALCCPIGLAVTNSSTTMADNVIVTLESKADESIYLLDEGDMRHFPSISNMPNIIPSGFRKGRRVDVNRYGDIYEIKVQVGTVQPGVTGWSPENFYIAAAKSQTASLKATLSANNLRIPVAVQVEICIEPTSRQVDLPEIVSRANARR